MMIFNDQTWHGMLAHVCTHARTHTQTRTHTHAHTHAHTRAHTYTHTHTHTDTQTHTHTCTHTCTLLLTIIPITATGTHWQKSSISQSESTSPSPKTKKKGLFRGFRTKDESKVTPPSSPSLLAQEAVKKAATLPRDFVGLPSSKDSPTQLSPSDVDSGVYDHDHGVDEVPEIPERPDDLGMSDDDSPPPVPPRQYLSDFESDNEDEAADDDEGEIIKTIYDYLALAGGPSQETEKLYDTLDQYRKVHLREKNEPKGDYSEVSHSTTSDVLADEGQYATVQEALEQVGVYKWVCPCSPLQWVCPCSPLQWVCPCNPLQWVCPCSPLQWACPCSPLQWVCPCSPSKAVLILLTSSSSLTVQETLLTNKGLTSEGFPSERAVCQRKKTKP